MAKLSVHLVAWNGAKYIPYALASLRAQTFRDWELLVIDNNSTDGTPDLVEQELRNYPVTARLIRNEKNLGFAGGHNQAVCEGTRNKKQGTKYIQLLNQDMYLAPEYLERVVAMMEEHGEAGAGQGILLRWDFSKMQNVELRMKNDHNPPQSPLILRGEECGLTNIIDTMGLKVMRNRRVVDFRTGERIPSPPTPLPRGEGGRRPGEGGVIEVFGVSGALPIYRRKAIEDVMFQNQMFDEDFFMYKEDVDLAFRIRAAGWRAYVVPEAKAWHDRTAAGPREASDRAALKNRKTKSAFINYHSYKNHLMVLLKNEHCANFTKDWPAIVWYEFKKWVYLLFTDWATLKGLREVCKLWKRTIAKRRFIMQNYRVRPEELRRWFL